MYIRFCTQDRHPWSRVPGGLFTVAYRLRADPAVEGWLRGAIADEIAWFEEHLPVPARFGVRSKRHWLSLGVCWFRAGAAAHVARAFALVRWLDAAGAPLGRLETDRPGQILYRDPFQVVARPEFGSLSAW
jgi:hypothetical protein